MALILGARALILIPARFYGKQLLAWLLTSYLHSKTCSPFTMYTFKISPSKLWQLADAYCKSSQLLLLLFFSVCVKNYICLQHNPSGPRAFLRIWPDVELIYYSSESALQPMTKLVRFGTFWREKTVICADHHHPHTPGPSGISVWHMWFRETRLDAAAGPHRTWETLALPSWWRTQSRCLSLIQVGLYD